MAVRQVPPTLMNTWVFVTFLSKIKPGSRKPILMMNRDLVLWRTQSGAISLLDAYCTHMGAHLGYGVVRGEVLECVFHKRCFNTKGICPGRGNPNKSYPLYIMHDMVFAWFGDQQPSWKMPDFLSNFPLYPESKWKIFKVKKRNYHFPPKDLLDNTVDAMHFKTFHHRCDSYQPPQILKVTDYSFISKVIFFCKSLSKLNMEMELETESYGPCTLIVNSTVKVKKQEFLYKFIFLCVPIKNVNTDYTLALAVKTDHYDQSSLIKKILNFIFNNYSFYVQLFEFHKESKMVWELKTYLPKPDISSNEKAIYEYNNWYNKFYVTDP